MKRVAPLDRVDGREFARHRELRGQGRLGIQPDERTVEFAEGQRPALGVDRFDASVCESERPVESEAVLGEVQDLRAALPGEPGDVDRREVLQVTDDADLQLAPP